MWSGRVAHIWDVRSYSASLVSSSHPQSSHPPVKGSLSTGRCYRSSHHSTETRMTYTTLCRVAAPGGGGLPDSGNKQYMRVYLHPHVRAEYDSYVLNHLMGGGMTVWISCAVLLLQFTHSSRRIQASSLCPHIGLHLLYHPPPISLSDPRRSICAAVVFKFTPNPAVMPQRCVRLINFWAIKRINWGIFSQILLSVKWRL